MSFRAFEPACALGRDRRQVFPDDLDEHQLAEAQADAFPTRAALARFRDGEFDQLAERVMGGAECLAHMQQRRQRFQQWVEWARVAAEEAAHDIQPLLAAATLLDGERELARGHLLEELQDLRPIGTASHPSRDRHHVRVAVREHQDVTCFEPHRIAIR